MKSLSKNLKLFSILVILATILLTVLLVYQITKTTSTIEDIEASVTTYKKWDEITLDFIGNHTNLTQNNSNPNPFLDYRLTVTFTNGSKIYTVPGYFIGNGSGGSGNKWRAHFTADQDGLWTYSATLTTGSNVAVNGGGSSVGVTPTSGNFQVSGDSTAGGFYSDCGRLNYVGEYYLKCAKTGRSWIKGGTNSPENFMAGADTGNEANIKSVIDYLSSQEVNSIYFLPNNIGGDGKGDTHPFAFNYTSLGAVTLDNLTHYDVNRLNKWGELFNYAQKKGISLEFVLNETENENANLLGAPLTSQRKLFYRELIARFSHLPAIKWIVIEENIFSNEQLTQFAGYIRSNDPYNHPIAVHTPVDSPDFYNGLLGNPNFDSTSFQFYTTSGSADNASAFSETWREKSKTAGRPWTIDLDEAILKEDSGYGMTKGNMDDLRRRVLYPGYFSGANISWYYGYDQDLGMSLWKFQDREAMWKWMKYARRLLLEFPDIAKFQSGDNLVTSQSHSGGKTQVYYYPGKAYLIYMAKTKNEENLKIDLSSATGGPFSMQWFNPRTGQYVGSPINIQPTNNFSIGASPDREDWVVVIKSPDANNITEIKAYHENNGLVVIQPETKPISTGWITENTISGFTGNGYIKYNGPDYFTAPGNALIEYKLNISTPGRYNISLRSNKMNPDASEDNDVWMKVDNGTWYKTYNGNPDINKWVWNTQYEIVHHEDIPQAYADLSAGIHTLYLSGRSSGFYIDRIHLYLPNKVSVPFDISLPESEYKNVQDSPLLSCNSICVNNTQCQTNYCASQFNFQNWSDKTSEFIIKYKENNTIKTASGDITSLNQFVNEKNELVIHIVINGKLFYKKQSSSGVWDEYYQDQTSNLDNAGNGKLISFNSFIKNGVIYQHTIKSNESGIKMFARDNAKGWSTWRDVTSDIQNIGSGEITGFTSFANRDGNIEQDLIRNGKIWYRNNFQGWSDWVDITSNLDSCTGKETNSCGEGRIIAVERVLLANGTQTLYIIREGNKIYARPATTTNEKRCRLSTAPYSNSCIPSTTTPPPTHTPTASVTPITNTPTPPENRPSCEITHTLSLNGKPGSTVEYTIKLNNIPTTPNTPITLNSTYSKDYLGINKVPENCTVNGNPISQQNTSSTQVAGVSDYLQENNSFIISIFLFTLLLGGITTILISANKDKISISIIKEKPYIAGLVMTTITLSSAMVYLLTTISDTSPDDSSAITIIPTIAPNLQCEIQRTTKEIKHIFTIKAPSQTKITYTIDMNLQEPGRNFFTCSDEFEVTEAEVTITPSITPTLDMTSSPTPTITPTDIAVPTYTLTPSPTPIEITRKICGSADINKDGRFTLIDFAQFAISYGNGKNICEDTLEEYISYGSCGGKDVDMNGRLELFDFGGYIREGGYNVGFARRYFPKKSCALPEQWYKDLVTKED